LGGKRGRAAADLLLAIGIVSSVPTAAAGLSDWSDTYGEETRVGLVHAAANVVGLGFYTASLGARIRGRRGRGRVLALLGMGAMTVGGYLGGHLSYARGVGVNHAFDDHGPEEWTPVLGESDLPQETPTRVDADGT